VQVLIGIGIQGIVVVIPGIVVQHKQLPVPTRVILIMSGLKGHAILLHAKV
jgi:hypothetical protein